MRFAVLEEEQAQDVSYAQKKADEEIEKMAMEDKARATTIAEEQASKVRDMKENVERALINDIPLA